jgi:hypothetical protein
LLFALAEVALVALVVPLVDCLCAMAALAQNRTSVIDKMYLPILLLLYFPASWGDFEPEILMNYSPRVHQSNKPPHQSEKTTVFPSD